MSYRDRAAALVGSTRGADEAISRVILRPSSFTLNEVKDLRINSAKNLVDPSALPLNPRPIQGLSSPETGWVSGLLCLRMTRSI